jgi:carboxyl-terminal processing protease
MKDRKERKERPQAGRVGKQGKRWQGKVALLVATSLVSFGILTGFYGVSDSEMFLKIHRGIDLFGKVYKEIATNYVDEVDPERFMKAGIDGMLKTLDPYTVYIGEKDNDEIDLVTTGKYAGVGITIGLRDGIVTVINPLEGYSAAKQGIQPGDRILEIDGTTITATPMEDVRLLVRGAPGTSLRMKVGREGEAAPLEFVLMREEIPVRNVPYAGFVEEGIGYIRLERFSRTAGDDVRSALKELKAKGTIRSLVLDLRDNPGGLLDVAVDVVSKFVPESSLVVSTRGRKSEADRKYYSVEKPLLPDAALAVLVDRGSASASEIVAGAVQDLDRGVIVGTRTFGKGLVQTITRLSENTSLKITSGRYYTPSGRSIQEIDYFHRSKGDVFTVKPDSLRKEYRTSHNRRVFDSGGIRPDSIVGEELQGKFLQELHRKAMFFKFANQYAVRNKSLPENFDVSADLLKDFEKFLLEKEFTYQEEAEAKLGELREIASKSRYGPSFHDGFERMVQSVEGEKVRAFERYNKELRSALKQEIIARIKGARFAIESSLREDPTLRVALTLLKNRTAYSGILAGKPSP